MIICVAFIVNIFQFTHSQTIFRCTIYKERKSSLSLCNRGQTKCRITNIFISLTCPHNVSHSFFPPCSHLTIFGPLWDQKRLYLKHPMHPHHKLAKSETFHLCWKGRKIWSDIPERSCRMDWLKHCSNNRSNTKNEFNNLNNSLNRFSSMIIIFNLYVQFM